MRIVGTGPGGRIMAEDVLVLYYDQSSVPNLTIDLALNSLSELWSSLNSTMK